MGASVPTLQRDCRSRRWSSTSPRQRKRQVFAGVLLLFAGSLTLLQWRAATRILVPPPSLSDSTLAGRLGGGSYMMEGDTGAGQCSWHDGAPMLYSLKHSRLHRDAGNWFEMAECFIGRRAEFKEYFAEMQGARVYIQDSDPNWTAGLTPMTRLILAAGLSSVGVGSVHMIDGTHSFLTFSTSTSETEGGVEGGVALRGAESATSLPRSAQVGVLHMDKHAYESQFVISPSQRLWERLVVSAPLETVNGGEGGVTVGSPGPDRPECVKYIAEVRLWEERREETWFPNGPQDARSLQLALHNFCPISWLDEEGGDGDGEGHGMVEGGWGGGLGGNRAHYNSQPRKVVIYQRDRDRQMLNSNEVANEIWERLGNIGWSVVELIHSETHRTPCDLVAEIASADVLLTTHGFQSMLALFMRPGTVLFEVFPYRYFRDDYHQLAKGLGLRYGFSTSRRMIMAAWPWFPKTETCMQWRLCRWYTGRADVEFQDDDLEVLISMMLEGGRIR